MTQISIEDIDRQLTIDESNVPVSSYEARFLHDFILERGIKKTMEVGFAYARSAAYIMTATRSQHIAIDPFQLLTYFGAGLWNIEKLGLIRDLDFYEDYSHSVLPKLLSEGRSFEFIFIDGDHKYDGVFIDFYFADLLLEMNGYIVLHDAWMRSTCLVESFIKTNRKDYVRVPIHTSFKNLVVFQKIARDSRTQGMEFCEFYTNKSRLLFPLLTWLTSRRNNHSIVKKVVLQRHFNYVLSKIFAWELKQKKIENCETRQSVKTDESIVRPYKINLSSLFKDERNLTGSGKKVKVERPFNMSQTDAYLFTPYLDYTTSVLSVKNKTHVFVAYTGFCSDENGLIEESHHRYPEQLESFNQELQNYYNLAEGDEKLVSAEDDDLYTVIHHPWINYYNWLMEAIPRLLLMKDQLKNICLVLPEEWMINYVISSLGPFTFKEVITLPKGQSLYLQNLCLPQLNPVMIFYDPDVVTSVSQLYLNFIKEQNRRFAIIGRKVYVKSKFSEGKLKNEKAFEEVLRKQGFRIVELEKCVFYDLVSIFSYAKYIFSLSGYGLTNMLFMTPGSSVLELHTRSKDCKDSIDPAYWYLASAKKHRYLYQFCESAGDGGLLVNIEEFKRNLGLMLT